ncbi:hypothetical protein RRG08_019830 [Elysia crispata]|uniref:Uncharacterized protein n=1 Tax=Elysia crispata TaxID=231223 RepID=A0AAE1B2V9_9GAST|nr:hypothetical protein RRG08_019830 [Elysia crispata]
MNISTDFPGGFSQVEVLQIDGKSQLLGFGRTLGMVALCWLAGHLIILACIGFNIPDNSICYISAVMPRVGIIIVSAVCLISCCLTIVMNLRVLKRIRRRPEQRAHEVHVSTITQDLNQRSSAQRKEECMARIRRRRTSSVTPISCFTSSIPRLSKLCPTSKQATLALSATPPCDLLETSRRKAIEGQFHNASDHMDKSKTTPTLPQTQTESSLPKVNNLIDADAALKGSMTESKRSDQNPYENGVSHSASDLEAITLDNTEFKNTCTYFETSEKPNSSDAHQQQVCGTSSLILSLSAGNVAYNVKNVRETEVTTTIGIEENMHTNAIAVSLLNVEGESEKQISVEVNRGPQGHDENAPNQAQFEPEVDCDILSANKARDKFENTTQSKTTQEGCISNVLDIIKQSRISCNIDCQSKNSQSFEVFPVYTQKSRSSAESFNFRLCRKSKICKLKKSRSQDVNSIRSKSTEGNETDFGSPILLQYNDASKSIGKSKKINEEKWLRDTTKSKSSEVNQKHLKEDCENRMGNVTSHTSSSISFGISNLTFDNEVDSHKFKLSEYRIDPMIFCDMPSSSSTSQEHVMLDHVVVSAGHENSSMCRHTKIPTSSTIQINKDSSSGSTGSRIKLDSEKSDQPFSNSISERQSQKRNWRRRTQNTLLILCSWCCLLSLPYIIYGGYVAIWIEDRVSQTKSQISMRILDAYDVFQQRKLIPTNAAYFTPKRYWQV